MKAQRRSVLGYAARLNFNAHHSARVCRDVQIAACAVSSESLEASVFEQVGDVMLAHSALLLGVALKHWSAKHFSQTL